MIPLKIMKGTVFYDENKSKSTSFLLPFLFMNYLKPIEFEA